MLATHKFRRGLRPPSPLHVFRQSSVVSTSANLQKQISKAASVYGIVLPFSSVECEKFYVIAADYLTPKIFDYKELLSSRDSTLISSMRSNYRWQAESTRKLCADDASRHHPFMPARVGNVISAVAGFRTDHQIVVAGGLGQIFGGGAKRRQGYRIDPCERVEIFTARGNAAVRRVADEFKAGVRYFDLHIGGSSSVVSGMLDEGILDMRLGQATRRERRQGSHVGQRVSPSRESVGREARKNS